MKDIFFTWFFLCFLCFGSISFRVEVVICLNHVINSCSNCQGVDTSDVGHIILNPLDIVFPGKWVICRYCGFQYWVVHNSCQNSCSYLSWTDDHDQFCVTWVKLVFPPPCASFILYHISLFLETKPVKPNGFQTDSKWRNHMKGWRLSPAVSVPPSHIA